MARGCRMTIDSLPLKYQQEVFKQLAYDKKTCDRTADTATDLESPTSLQPVAAKENPRYGSPCRIHVHSIRKRLTDADGISGKAAIDGIVHSGILEDDSPQFVKEVSYSQEKGKPEKTIITIEEITD